jgi:NADH-quinone oxidoreductase subunit H
MNLGWKVLIPSALIWLVAVMIIQGVRQFSDTGLTRLLVIIVAVLVVVLIVTFLIPEKKVPEEEEPAEPEPFDAFAGGYPVPPLPGQELPPSPRRLRRQQAESQVATSARAGGTPTDTDQEA